MRPHHPVDLTTVDLTRRCGTVTFAADASQDSHTPTLEILILGGAPIREPIATYGPFDMNTADEIRQAFEDIQAGRLGTIPAE